LWERDERGDELIRDHSIADRKNRVTDSFAGQTVETARRMLAARLRNQAIESAELDARLLTGAVLGLDLTGLISAAARRLNDDEATQLDDFARRRMAGEPVARILGIKEFWGLPLSLTSATLVPRPDTETIVEAALDILRAEYRDDHPLRIADLGTGSGAILLALLSERPDAFGIGTDISETALQTAKNNANQLGLAPRAAFVACDYAAALSGAFDLIVSNPPYIPSGDIATLATEVRDHDPRRALDGGRDGLDAYRRIAPEAARLLTPHGSLILEVGHDQSAAVEGLLTTAGLSLPGAPKADLAGIRRAVTGRNLPS
jgi:release factor glutamine methyltransferase